MSGVHGAVRNIVQNRLAPLRIWDHRWPRVWVDKVEGVISGRSDFGYTGNILYVDML